MGFSRTSRILISPGVLVRDLGGESVLLNLNSESHLGLNEVGTQMWSVLTASRSIQVAYETLLGEYEVEPEKLSRDLDDFIETLMSQGLVEIAAE